MTATTRPNQRERILDVALALMSEHGASKMSMRQLARDCDLNVAAIYHYFESKDALLAAVVDERRYGSRLADVPDIDPSQPPEHRLRELFGYTWQGALEEAPIWRLLLGEGLRNEPTVLPVGRQLLGVLHPGLTAWIGAAIPEIAQPDAAANVVLGAMFTGFITHIFDPDRATADLESELADALVLVLLGSRAH